MHRGRRIKHKKLEVLACAINKLNHRRVHAIHQMWDSLNTTKHGHMKDGNIANGIFLCLLKIGLSTIEIQSMIKVGGESRLTRLQKITTNQDRVVLPCSHELSTKLVDIFRDFFKQLDSEDGFLCPHRRPKFYVLKNDKAVSWTELH